MFVGWLKNRAELHQEELLEMWNSKEFYRIEPLGLNGMYKNADHTNSRSQVYG